MLGARPAFWTRVEGGWTAAGRWIVREDAGSSAFVKIAADPQTANWLRDEYSVYSQLSGTFLPDLLGWDGEDPPILVLEDLSAAHWPPPWSSATVERVLETLAAVRSCSVPLGRPALVKARDTLTSWRHVAVDPAPFLSLGLCTPQWLEAVLPALMAAEAQAILDGPDLLHLDVRSDNICLTPSRAILVDWNWACRGNGRFDVAAWLPSLHAEGGPAPEEILADEPALAALLSGFWALRAGPSPQQRGSSAQEAGRKQLARKQLATALPWAARALSLPPPVPTRA